MRLASGKCQQPLAPKYTILGTLSVWKTAFQLVISVQPLQEQKGSHDLYSKHG